MTQKINAFRGRKLKLIFLINDLEALCEVLEPFNNKWKERFSSAWFLLEMTYAVALDKGKKILDSDDEKTIELALKQIEELIAEAISL